MQIFAFFPKKPIFTPIIGFFTRNQAVLAEMQSCSKLEHQIRVRLELPKTLDIVATLCYNKGIEKEIKKWIRKLPTK
jgi:hypothetical protein